MLLIDLFLEKYYDIKLNVMFSIIWNDWYRLLIINFMVLCFGENLVEVKFEIFEN